MLNILVVDDEAPIREWLAYCIQRAGECFRIIGMAKSGKEAYDMVVLHKPDVVITDIKMPGMDGIELMQLVKKVLPYTVFVILTNYAEFSYAKKAVTYGAKDYLLKSELRGVDLVNILEEVLDEKRNIIGNKNKEVLSNGYVDLYSLYQNYEDEEYCVYFWKNLGMGDKQPYNIIGVVEDITFNQRQVLTEIAQEVSPNYFHAALKNQIIYVVIQEETNMELEQTSNRFATLYFEKTRQNIAIGQVQHHIKLFLQATEQVQSVLSSTFFTVEKRIFICNDIVQIPKLDRKVIWQGYREILSSLSLKQCEKAVDEIHTWFNYFLKLHPQDVMWAKEMCIKMVISIEERFYQVNSGYEDSGTETQKLNSALICKEVCLNMVEKMVVDKNGIKVKSINEALDYIHKNYNQDISLIKVANHIYRSPEYFSRLFKEETGVNFSVYLMMHRLGCAEHLLKTSDLQISQIAYEVGYTNPGYFSRIYKKYMGMTPEEARYQNSTKRSK